MTVFAPPPIVAHLAVAATAAACIAAQPVARAQTTAPKTALPSCKGTVLLQQMDLPRELIGFAPERNEMIIMNDPLAVLVERYFGKQAVLVTPEQVQAAAASECWAPVVKATMESYRSNTAMMLTAMEARVSLAFYRSPRAAQPDFTVTGVGADKIVGGTVPSAYVEKAVSAAARRMDEALSGTGELYLRSPYACRARVCMELMELSEAQAGMKLDLLDRMRLNAIMLDAVRKGLGERVDAAERQELAGADSCTAMVVRLQFSSPSAGRSETAELTLSLHTSAAAGKPARAIAVKTAVPPSPRNPPAAALETAFRALAREVEPKLKDAETKDLMRYLPAPRSGSAQR